MPTTTTNFGWTVPSDTDLVKDGAAAIRTALGGPDTSFVDLKGGTTGQVLSKASGTDLDFTWVAQDDSNAIQNAIVDAKGDLIAATAADTPARLAVGTNGQILTADSTAATGLAWVTPSASASGLTQIHSSTFSAVSSKSVTGCFTSTYRNYKVIFIITTGTVSASTKLRFSVSGTDDTNSLYSTGFAGTRTNGTFAPIISAAQNTADIGRIEANSTQTQTMEFDIMNPQVANRTGFAGTAFIEDSSGYVGIGGGGTFNANTQFDGITFYPTAGTMSGSIAIYGYSN